MNDMESAGNELNEVLSQQGNLLGEILKLQRTIRLAARNRDWQTMEAESWKLDGVSQMFAGAESRRKSILRDLGAADGNFYSAVSRLSVAQKEEAFAAFRLVRQKLTISRTENDALRNYIKTAQGFVKGVLDEADSKRCKTYSATGEIVKGSHGAFVMNAVG